MIKPVGAICNLDCTYCYYLHKEDLLGSPSKFRISDEILETHIKQYIEGQDRNEVVFSWQGGEPTLLGLEFFHKVVELEQKYKKPNQRIENDLQTNGTLLDDEWGLFLKKHGFLVGLSIDGPKELHDRYRVAKDGKPTFDKVFAAAQMLHRHRVPFNVLCVINRVNAKRPLDVYRFFKNEVRPRQMQFIPCVEPKVFTNTAPQRWDPNSLPIQDSPAAHPGTPDSVVTDWSVDPDDWGYFLCKVWDDWYRRDIGKVFVNHFESAVGAVDGPGIANVRLSRVLRQRRGPGARRQSLLLRPLCLSRIQARQHPSNFKFAHGLLRTAAPIRIRQVSHPSPPVPRVQIPLCL